MAKMYGIPNCDTIKKAKRWLEKNQIAYDFHDYKKLGVDANFLAAMITEHGVDVIVNKRGTTFRKLSDEEKQALNSETALDLLTHNPSMIKRPILVVGEKSLVGFKESEYQALFGVD